MGWLRDERGSIAAILALAMGVLLSMTALVVDGGLLYLVRARLADAADASALAGVQELPENPEEAELVARDFASRNGVPAGGVVVNISDNWHRIEVEVSQTVNLMFARLFGFRQVEVKAKSCARVGPVRAVKGAVPFGVERQAFEYGVQYTLNYVSNDKDRENGRHRGNFGALALGGTGGGTYRDNIKYGYSGTLHVGDWVETEPGRMAGPTWQGVEYRINQCDHVPGCSWNSFVPGCPRLVYVPIVDSAIPPKGRDYVQIVGFAAFFLEGVEGHGSSARVTGTFIRTVIEGECWDGEDFGLRSCRLVE
ncbi:MAG TPA: hypothetical protein GX506_03090 [Firmicutes bacterium]|nr:hypothetical protein [Bacillota bacterium]